MRLEVLEDRFAPAILTWVGDVDTSWNTDNAGDTNWSGNVLPADGDTLIFGGAAVGILNNNTTGGNNYTLQFTASGYTIEGSPISLGNVDAFDISDTVGGNFIATPLTYVTGTAVDAQAGILTLTGALSSGGANFSFTKDGAGTLVIPSASQDFGTLTVSAGTLKIATGTAGSSNTIGLNFHGGNGSPALLAADSAGVVAQTNWNNATGASGTPNSVLVDSTGGATTATLTSYNANGGAYGTTSSNKLLNGYLDNTSNTGSQSVVISNIPYASYDVYAYFGSDTANRTGRVQVGATSYYFRSRGNVTTFIETTDTTGGSSPNANYSIWTGITGTTMTMNLFRLSDNIGLHGLQIVPASPPLTFGTTSVVVAAGAILDLNGNKVTIGSLEGAGNVTSTAGAATLTTGGNNNPTTYTGTITNGGGTVSLIKTGTGTFTLGGTGTNTLNAGISVQDGTLKLADNDNRLPTSAIVTLGTSTNTAVLDLGDTNQTVAGLAVAAGATAANVSVINSGVALKTLTVNTAAAQTFTGHISGSLLNVLKTGTNDFSVSGSTGNTPNSWQIDAGRVFFDAQTGLGSGPVTINNGGTLNYNGGSALALSNAVTINSGGNIASRSAQLTVANATLPTAGTLIINQDTQSTNTVILGGDIALTGSLTIQVGAGGTPGLAQLNGLISGSAAITKTQIGTLFLNNGGNSFDSVLTISAGTVRVAANNALGTVVGGTTVVSGATLEFNGAFDYTTAEPIAINGAGVGGVGAINKIGGNGALSSPITLQSSATIGSATASNKLTLDGAITMPSIANITFTGAGDVDVTQAFGNGATAVTSAGLEARLLMATGLGIATTAGIATALSNTPTAVTTLSGALNFPNGPTADAAITTFFGGGNPGGNNFTALFRGQFVVPTTGTYAFAVSQNDDAAVIWIDRDGDNTFSTTGSAGNELIQTVGCCGNTAIATVTLNAGTYNILYAVEDTGGDSGIVARFQDEPGPFPGNATLMTIVDPTAQPGRWSYTNQPLNNVIKNGAGTVTFLGNNTYNGTTAINAGTLVAGSSAGTTGGLGEGSAAVSVLNGATLGFANGATVSGKNITANGAGAAGKLGAITNISGSNSYSGTITALAASAGNLGIGAAAGTLTLDGAVALNYSKITFNTAASANVIVNSTIGGVGVSSTSSGLEGRYFPATTEQNIIDIGNNTATGGLLGMIPAASNSPYAGALNFDNNFGIAFPTLGGSFRGDNFTALWIGSFTPNQLGTWTFNTNNLDDNSRVYLDRNGDGTFNTATNEQIVVNGATSAAITVVASSPAAGQLVMGQSYLIAFAFREGGGDEKVNYRFTPPAGVVTTINPSLGAQSTLFTSQLISDNSLVKTGAGTVTLNAANTYNGNTTVSGGILATGISQALGVNPNSTLTVSGASAQLNLFDDASAITTVGTANFSAGTGTVNTGAAGGKLAINNQLSLSDGYTIVGNMTVQGANVVDNSVARTLTTVSGTTTVNKLAVPAAIAIVNSASNYYQANGNFATTTPYVVSSTANLLIVEIGQRAASAQPTSVTWGGVPLQMAAFSTYAPNSPTFRDVSIWYLVNPVPGSGTISVTGGAGNGAGWISAISVSGVDTAVAPIIGTAQNPTGLATGAALASALPVGAFIVSAQIGDPLNGVINWSTATPTSAANLTFTGLINNNTNNATTFTTGYANVTVAGNYTVNAAQTGATITKSSLAVAAFSPAPGSPGNISLAATKLILTGGTTLNLNSPGTATFGDLTLNGNASIGAGTNTPTSLTVGNVAGTATATLTINNSIPTTAGGDTVKAADGTVLTLPTLTYSAGPVDVGASGGDAGTVSFGGTSTGSLNVVAGTAHVSDGGAVTGNVTANTATTMSSGAVGSISGGLNAVGGIVNPGGSGTAGTLTLGGNLTADGASVFNFDFLNPGSFDVIAAGANALSLSGNPVLNVASPSMVTGTYDLITYASHGDANSFTLGTTPGGLFSYALNTTATAVQLVVTSLSPTLVWDNGGGGLPIADGSNTWNDGSGNFYNTSNSVAANYSNAAASDLTIGNGGDGGTITLTGVVRTGGVLTFATVTPTPYTISGPHSLTMVGGIIANHSATIDAPVLLELSQAWLVAASQTLSVNDSVGETSAGKSLTKSGAGTLLLEGAGSYTGGTFVNAGTLRIGSANDRLPVTGAVSIANAAGAILDLNDLDQTIGSLAGGGALGGQVTLGTGTLTVGDSNNTSFAGVISGTGGLTKQGGGTLILSAAQTYTGDTEINAGALTAGFSQTFVSGNVVNINSGGTLNVTAAGALAGVIVNIYSGGALNPTVAGALNGAIINVLTGASFSPTVVDTLSGTVINIDGGTLSATVAGALNGSAININASGTLTPSIVGGLTGTTVTINTGSNPLSPTVVNSLSGATIAIVGGTLAMGTTNSTVAGLSLQSGSITGSTGVITSSTAYDVRDGSIDAILAGATVALNKITAGTVILSRANTYTGATNITAGTLNVTGSTAAGSTVNVAMDGTLEGTGTVNGNATLTGNGIIDLTNPGTIAGTLAITGGNWNGGGTVTGAVTSTSGSFTLANGATLTATAGVSVTGGSMAFDGTIVGSLTTSGNPVVTSGVGATVTTANLFGTGSFDTGGNHLLVTNKITIATASGTITYTYGGGSGGNGTFGVKGSNLISQIDDVSLTGNKVTVTAQNFISGFDIRGWTATGAVNVDNYTGGMGNNPPNYTYDSSSLAGQIGTSNHSTYAGTIGYLTGALGYDLNDQTQAFTNGGTNTGPMPATGYATQYATEYRGVIYVATAGTYRFATRSDDGSALWINAADNPVYATAIVQNNNAQAVTRAQSAPIVLSAGYHTILVRFNQGGGGHGLFLEWDPTGGTNFVNIPGVSPTPVTHGGFYHIAPSTGTDQPNTTISVSADSEFALPAGQSTFGTLNLTGTTLTVSGGANLAVAGVNSTGTSSIAGATALGIAGANDIDVVGSLAINSPMSDGSSATAVTKNGAGVLTLAGVGTYTGATNVNAGTLLLNGTLTSPITTTGVATLGGSGSTTGAVDVGGTLAPGNPVGTLGVNNTLTLSGISRFEVTPGSGPNGTSDKVNGITTLNYGGDLAISPNPDGDYEAGDSWDLFDDFSSHTGAFTNIFPTAGDGVNLPTLTGGLQWTFSPGTGVLSIISSLAAPTVTGIAPAIGPTTGGTMVIITGSNFVSITSVTFGGIAATITGGAGTTQINVTTGNYGAAGAVEVVVTNSGGSGSLAGSNDFTYAAPAITSVVVNGGAGVVLGGSTWSLAGQHSVVKQIVVTFNQAVAVDSAAFTVTSVPVNPAGGPGFVVVNGGAMPSSQAVTATVAATLSPSSFLVTFSGPGTHHGGIINSGVYDLTTIASLVTANGEEMVSDQSSTFFAMFGNIEANNQYAGSTFTTPIPPGYSSGDGATTAFVDPGSLFRFSDTFGSTVTAPVGPPAYDIVFDYNLDGAIDPGDLFAFSDSFGIDWDF